MKEHPIIFNSEMFKAILDSKKTQTRRVVKPQSSVSDYRKVGVNEAGVKIKCPYGKIGDRLWVRETFKIAEIYPPPGNATEKLKVEYRADNSFKWFEKGTWKSGTWITDQWRPSIFMPRWASRITLEITNIRVERVQEIDWRGAKHEGIFPSPGGCSVIREHQSMIDNFKELWNSINEKRGFGWDKNPWVWVISFKNFSPFFPEAK